MKKICIFALEESYQIVDNTKLNEIYNLWM